MRAGLAMEPRYTDNVWCYRYIVVAVVASAIFVVAPVVVVVVGN